MYRDEEEENEELEADDDFEDDESEDEEEEEDEDGDSDLLALIDEADTLVGEGEYLKAIKLWKRSLDRFSDEPAAYFHTAKCIHEFIVAEQGASDDDWKDNTKLFALSEDAIGYLQEAVGMDDDHEEAWLVLGQVLALRGDNEEAVVAFEKTLELNPNQKKAKKALQQLHDDE